ncbi:TonB-dependent siderophore receptor [Enterobacteriaceae bacterium RIT697]|uniref:TonB-dependent siderophore receptor n=1 Tax=Pantoea endophytica TaxID=92488 RepID=UPI0012AE1C66|nr:TonB-dependent siderophore receptor [Pantoea endophytica]MRT24906.1 TonB-dependent siderophore receptor [Enterobacteriaceae bacterium RIT697]
MQNRVKLQSTLKPLSVALMAILMASQVNAEETLNVVAASPDNNGLVATHSKSATKTDTPLLETPQSISVITRQQMDAQNVRSLNEALRYTPGVAAEQWGGVSAFDQFSIRGFNYGSTGFNDQFLDGLRMNNGLVYGFQQVDPFLLEDISVVRGPASVLYGLASPGGIIAMQSKLPTAENIRHVELEAGNHQYQRGSFDLGGKANDDGTVLYRIVGTATTREGQERGTEMRRWALAPSVTFQPDYYNKLTLYARAQNDPKMGAQTSLPVAGTARSNPNGTLPTDAYPGEPDHNTFSRKQAAVGYSADHYFNDDWFVTLNGRYSEETSNYNAVIFAGLENDQRTIDRSIAASDEHFNTLNFDNQLHGHFTTGELEHQLLLGMSWDRFTGHANYASGSVSSLDIFNPHYGAAVYGLLQNYQDTRVMNNQTGVYAQDQLSYQQWRATFGVRHDWSSIRTTDLLGYSDDIKQRDEATTWRAGVNYLFDNGIAPYFTYAQSFQPTTSVDSSGKPFDPSRGELYEAGIKYQPKSLPALFSIAAFNLTQDKVLTTDPLNAAYSVQGGKIRSRGLELEARGSVTDQISVIGAMTWQDVQYVQDSDPTVIGRTPLRIPTRFGSLWVNWEAPDISAVAGLGAGVGGRFSNGTKGGTMDNQFDTAGYGVMDAEVHYDLGHLAHSLKGGKVQLTAQNLTNRQYVTSCFTDAQGCFYGAERSVIAKLSWDF